MIAATTITKGQTFKTTGWMPGTYTAAADVTTDKLSANGGLKVEVIEVGATESFWLLLGADDMVTAA